MKPKSNTLTVAMVAAIVGAILGAGISGYFFAQFQSDATYSRFIADATIQLASLEKIQAGDTQGAVSILDTSLNGNIAALDLSDTRIPDSKREQIRQLLRRLNSYREKQKK